MLLVYQNKDNISYAYYNQTNLPINTTFYSYNKRGQELLLSIIFLRGKVYVISSLNELNKIYKMPIPVRIKNYFEYKTQKIKRGLGAYLSRLGARLNK